MTKKQKEKLSNRLVLNFGILLAAALVLLYVNTAFLSSGLAIRSAYTAMLVVAILSAVLGIFMFVFGLMKKSRLKNYSAICLGTFLASALIYSTKLGFISNFSAISAIKLVYILMAVYFIVMAIITWILISRPTVKTEAEMLEKQKRYGHSKKNKRK